MAVDSPSGVIIIAAALFLHAATIMVCGSDSVLKLERLIPPSHELSLAELRAFDSARHGRLLQSPVGGVVDFPVYGASDPFLVGLYYTKVKLGTPPREFNVQIDTGSDVLWVTCASCNGCPKTSELQIQLSFFDPGSSSSASMVSCSDKRCYSNFESESGCSPNNLCSYAFKYGDGSGTSGYYISDFMSFDTVITSTLAINSSAPFVFGCSNLQTGDLQRPRRAVDGIFGLGQGSLSVVSQLATQGLAPRVFSHCLKGDSNGGGVMVLGQIKRPDTVYTPLVPSQLHYNVNLQSIAVNNQILPIDPSVFTIATGDGTIIDTGTTLAYLPDEAYNPFIQAIASAVSQYGRPITYESYQCFDITSGAVDVFPEVSLSFAGGASMVLTPRDYLQMFSSSGSSIWCIGFQRSQQPRRITILGDLVLKDKVVVYDLVRQRIGWAVYDCSLEVNVSATGGGRSKDVINTGQWRENSSSETCDRSTRFYTPLFSSDSFPSTDKQTMANGAAVRLDLDGKPIKPLTICMIGAGGFIGSHLCEKLLNETPHKVLALDVYNDKIKHLLEPDTSEWAERIQFHRINIKHDSRLEGLVKMADLTINLAAICTPADYNTRPLDTIYSNFIDALPVVKYCSENNKRLIHFSTCEVYGKTIGSFLPKDHPLRQDPDFYVLKEDTSPCIFGSIEKQRWSYACAKQLIERLVYAEGAENGLEFTIVRPFNWIGPRMDFIPGIDGPSEGVPRVLACFSNNLLRREPLKLVDGGESQRTFIYIKDAIEAVLLMIENPERANGHIFNVGNPNNEVTVRQLAEMMTKVYSKVSGETAIESPTIDVSSKEFYGEGYDDSDKRIPDMTIINRQLGWNPKTSLWDLLESTLTYQHRTYAEAVKKATSKPVAS